MIPVRNTAPTYLSLFSGIGGLDLGLDRAGFRCVGQVEKDPFCQQVLAKHWPEVPRHDDVCTAAEWWRRTDRPAVWLVAGGPPCQPVSTAGRGLAQDDPRWLWEPMCDVVAVLRPTWVVVENVPGLRTRGLDTVLGDLGRLDYRAQAGTIRACEVGAPHPRERLFVMAHAASLGGDERPGPGQAGARGAESSRVRLAEPGYAAGWPAEPAVARMAHGVPAGVDRRRALGNAVVPAVGEYIGRLIRGADDHLVLSDTRPYPTDDESGGGR